MKRFAWRLQRVLDVRIKQESLKQNELFRLTQALAEKRTELLLRQRTLDETLAGVAADKSTRRFGHQELVLRHAAINDEQIRSLKEAIREIEVDQKKKLAELLAIRRFREALERLREEAKDQYVQEQEKLEQKEADERTVLAFARGTEVRL